jgi:hypothetical protein
MTTCAKCGQPAQAYDGHNRRDANDNVEELCRKCWVIGQAGKPSKYTGPASVFIGPAEWVELMHYVAWNNRNVRGGE